jgi:hypothetical protein
MKGKSMAQMLSMRDLKNSLGVARLSLDRPYPLLADMIQAVVIR